MSVAKTTLALIVILASPLLHLTPVPAATGTPDGIASRDPPLRTLPADLRDGLALTLRTAQAKVHRAWAAEVASFDAVHQHLLAMADMHSSGWFAPHPLP